MFIVLPDYKASAEFAKTFKKKNGQIGVSRMYINKLIHMERANIGTTGLDVLCIDGNYFVKYSKK